MFQLLLILKQILELDVVEHINIGEECFRPFSRQDTNDLALGASHLTGQITSHSLLINKYNISDETNATGNAE